MQLTRSKVIAMTLLAVLVVLGGASVFIQDGRSATTAPTIQLNPTSGCPGTPVSLDAHLTISDGLAAPATVTTGNAAIDGGIKTTTTLTLTTDPDGLMSGEKFVVTVNNGIDVSGSFVVSDSVCAGPYTVTLRLTRDTQTLESVSTVFVVGGQGCPGLPACRPVGGVVMPTNTLAIAAPYLALAGLIVAVSAFVAVKRRG